jgi:hypothetical protein
MVLCKVFKLSFVGASSVTIIACSSNTNDTAFQETKTPEIPAVFQGLACSMVKTSLQTQVSAPYSLVWSYYIVYLDLDIFRLRPTIYFPLSSQMIQQLYILLSNFKFIFI